MGTLSDAAWPVPPAFMTTNALRASGVTHRQLRSAIADGRLLRVRKGRYVRAGLTDDVIHAARIGGRLDCVSLLRRLGVFVQARAPLHVQLDPLASRLPTRPSDVVAHWRATAVPAEHLVTHVIEALVQATKCQGPRAAIATLDSAWHRGLVDSDGIAEVFARLPRKYRRLRPLLDRRSESGPESLMRLILRGLGCRIEMQVSVPGVGRVDFVVDGWLIIECDSEAFHSGWESQKRDRRRDLAAARLGYTTVRVLAEDVMFDREGVVRAFRDVLAHGPRRAHVPNS
jgi:very-short-patch-repair endonuclease